MSEKLTQQIEGPDKLVTGRYEAYGMNSNALGNIRNEDNPTYGATPDYKNDDPADIAASVRSTGTRSEMAIPLEGVPLVSEVFEARQAGLRRQYQEFINEGLKPMEAREKVRELNHFKGGSIPRPDHSVIYQ